MGDKHLFERGAVRHDDAMGNRPTAMILFGCIALSLGGCVAAVIPVAAGGMIGRSRLHERHDAAAQRSPDTRVATPVNDAVTSGPIRPVPADVAAMESGTPYAGALPVPVGAKTAAASLPLAVRPEPAGRTDWSEVLHYVATASEQRPHDSAIPARSATVGGPRWLPCADRPFAVLANLNAASIEGAAPYLRSIETLGIALLYTSSQLSTVAMKQASALRVNGLQTPVAGQGLFLTPAKIGDVIRSDLVARYCVLAIAGLSPKDFPMAISPDAPAHPGWFLIERRAER